LKFSISVLCKFKPAIAKSNKFEAFIRIISKYQVVVVKMPSRGISFVFLLNISFPVVKFPNLRYLLRRNSEFKLVAAKGTEFPEFH
jgi:hypothetical protein